MQSLRRQCYGKSEPNRSIEPGTSRLEVLAPYNHSTLKTPSPTSYTNPFYSPPRASWPVNCEDNTETVFLAAFLSGFLATSLFTWENRLIAGLSSQTSCSARTFSVTALCRKLKGNATNRPFLIKSLVFFRCACMWNCGFSWRHAHFIARYRA